MAVSALFHVLIIDESPDFAKSLGNMIIDVVGAENVLVKYAFNTQDGLKLVEQQAFHILFMGINLPLNAAKENQLLFNKKSLNPFLEFVVVSFHNESGFRSMMKEAGINKFLVKDEIDVDELTVIFELINQ